MDEVLPANESQIYAMHLSSNVYLSLVYTMSSCEATVYGMYRPLHGISRTTCCFHSYMEYLYHLQAKVYSEDFASERRDREAAHGKFADLQKKYDHDVGESKAQLAQMEEDLHRHRERLAEVELVYQKKEKEMRSVLEEASNNQTEVQAKTSQVKQYKKQVDSLKDQVGILAARTVYVHSCLLAHSVHQQTQDETVFSNLIFSV